MSNFLCENPVEALPDTFVNASTKKACDCVQAQNLKLDKAMQTADDDTSFLTATADALTRYEKALDIDDLSDDLDFRRERLKTIYITQPPFTSRFFADQLNAILGKGRWTAYINAERTTLTVETSVDSQSRSMELSATINRIKPCSIQYISKPVKQSIYYVSSDIAYSTRRSYYMLGQWRLGEHPFEADIEAGSVTRQEGSKIMSKMADLMAQAVCSGAVKAKINNSVTIDTVTAQVVDGYAVIEYTIPQGTVATISNIKLLDASGNILSNDSVYVPAQDTVTMKHKIKVMEG